MFKSLPRHITMPTLSDNARAMLRYIAVSTMATGVGGYVASWHISKSLPWASDLDVVISGRMPGYDAMCELQQFGLVEDVPDLGCRYRLTALGCAVSFVLFSA